MSVPWLKAVVRYISTFCESPVTAFDHASLAQVPLCMGSEAPLSGERARLAHHAACDNIPDDRHAIDKEYTLLRRHVAEVDDVCCRPKRVGQHPQVGQPAFDTGSIQGQQPPTGPVTDPSACK